jgi:hypothetical protein
LVVRVVPPIQSRSSNKNGPSIKVQGRAANVVSAKSSQHPRYNVTDAVFVPGIEISDGSFEGLAVPNQRPDQSSESVRNLQFADRDYRAVFLSYRGQYSFRFGQSDLWVDLQWLLGRHGIPAAGPSVAHDDLALFLAAHGTKEGHLDFEKHSHTFKTNWRFVIEGPDRRGTARAQVQHAGEGCSGAILPSS